MYHKSSPIKCKLTSYYYSVIIMIFTFIGLSSLYLKWNVGKGVSQSRKFRRCLYGEVTDSNFSLLHSTLNDSPGSDRVTEY